MDFLSHHFLSSHIISSNPTQDIATTTLVTGTTPLTILTSLSSLNKARLGRQILLCQPRVNPYRSPQEIRQIRQVSHRTSLAILALAEADSGIDQAKAPVAVPTVVVDSTQAGLLGARERPTKGMSLSKVAKPTMVARQMIPLQSTKILLPRIPRSLTITMLMRKTMTTLYLAQTTRQKATLLQSAHLFHLTNIVNIR